MQDLDCRALQVRILAVPDRRQAQTACLACMARESPKTPSDFFWLCVPAPACYLKTLSLDNIGFFFSSDFLLFFFQFCSNYFKFIFNLFFQILVFPLTESGSDAMRGRAPCIVS